MDLFFFFTGGTKMEITKRQALSLVKALSHYNSLTMVGTNYSIINDTEYLLDELEEFILDERQEYDMNAFKDVFKVDGDIEPGTLVNLKPTNCHIVSSVCGDPGDDVELRFKKVIKDGGEVDTYIIMNGNKESIGPVTYVKLFDRELQIATGQGNERCWNYFDLEIVSAGWISAFGHTKSCLRVIN